MLYKHCIILMLSITCVLSQSKIPTESVDLNTLIDGLFKPDPGVNGDGNTSPASEGPPIAPTEGTVVQPEPVANCVGGDCVPFYLCSDNNTVIEDGAGIIDIRFGDDEPPRQCADYLETCCGATSQVTVPIVDIKPKSDVCGFRNRDGIGYRITGGKDNEAEYGEFPWMVAIVREEQQGEKKLNIYLAGGSLIHPKVVLTAAHYVHNRKNEIINVRGGEWDTQTENEIFPHVDRRVVEVITHEHFNKGNLQNDIALLILDEPMELAENINTVCLPPQSHSFENDRQCWASGWGKDVYGREGKYQVILKRIELPIVPRRQCESTFKTTRLGKRFNLHESFICAGGVKGKDTCYGDGGSPLVCPTAVNQPNRYYQAGIVAWGLGCGDDLPAAYTNVALFRNWIDSQMQLRNLEKGFYIA